MRDSRRFLPLLPLAALLACATIPSARAQTPSARYAFADTTLLRDTLDLSFIGLFPLADSLRVTPDSLRAWSIRYTLPIGRVAYLADSLHMPADSVGPVLLRERFNPLARARDENSTSFTYSTTYNTAKQNTSWSNNVTYDVSRGPILLHNVTSVRIDRYLNTLGTSRYRANNTTTELGWRLTPEAALGMRVNLQRVAAKVTNEYQGSLRARRDFGHQRTLALNLFGGAYDQQRDNLTGAAKRGAGSNADTRFEYAPTERFTFTLNGKGSYRVARTGLPKRTQFDAHDATLDGDGTFTLQPLRFATLRLTATANHSRIEQPTTFGPRSRLEDRLVQEPSGGAGLESGLQLDGGRFGTLSATATLGRTTSLSHSEDTTGVHFNPLVHHDRGVHLDGRTQFAGWSVSGQMDASRPDDESARPAVRTPIAGGQPITAYYRELGRTGTRSLNGAVARKLSTTLTLNVRGDIGLTQYRYAVTDTSQLAGTVGALPVSGDYDNYRQSLRVETSYAPSSANTTTLALELDHTATVHLTSDASAENAEDRTYRAEWRWTYRLLRDLTVNQNTQLSARYDQLNFAPSRDRLSMDYRTITTLNARITPRLGIEMNHSATYGPRGGYLASADGSEFYYLTDATRDYQLQGRITYTPTPEFTLNFQPTYHAFYDEDRSSGPALRRSGWRQLTVAGGATLNVPIGRVGRLNGTIANNLDQRRDITYRNGLPVSAKRSVTPSYWSGQLQFTWSLK